MSSETATAPRTAPEHEHDPHLAHHFDSLEQQHLAQNLGMWAFLATEVMFFGGLFTALVVFQVSYPRAFAEGSHHLSVPLGTFNTLVLLTSSLTMALAVHAAQTDQRRALVRYLLATMLLGAVFLGVKAVEYTTEFYEGLVPGAFFTYYDDHPVPEGVDPRHVELFYLIYFCMTGLHAFHLVIGIVIVGIIAVMAQQGTFSRRHYMGVELTGLYWHFVDVVWVFLFPVLYLIEAHQR